MQTMLYKKPREHLNFVKERAVKIYKIFLCYYLREENING